MNKLLIILIFLSLNNAWATDYPTRPIRMVVAYAPGGTTDFTARATAPAEFAKFVAAEIANWTKVAKAGNIKAQ